MTGGPRISTIRCRAAALRSGSSPRCTSKAIRSSRRALSCGRYPSEAAVRQLIAPHRQECRHPARQHGLPVRRRAARRARDLVRERGPARRFDATRVKNMVNQLDYLKETASQTAGPYVHIGLAPQQAGFDIFENNFSNVLAGPEDQRRAYPHRRTRHRRIRDAAARCAAGDLAGQRGGQIQPPGRQAGQGDRQDVSRLGPRVLGLRDRRLRVRYDQARRRSRAATSVRWRRM